MPRDPGAAALRLVAALGVGRALDLATRELRLARRARSRTRYRFWTQVDEHLRSGAVAGKFARAPVAAVGDREPAHIR